MDYFKSPEDETNSSPTYTSQQYPRPSCLLLCLELKRALRNYGMVIIQTLPQKMCFPDANNESFLDL